MILNMHILCWIFTLNGIVFLSQTYSLWMNKLIKENIKKMMLIYCSHTKLCFHVLLSSDCKIIKGLILFVTRFEQFHYNFDMNYDQTKQNLQVFFIMKQSFKIKMEVDKNKHKRTFILLFSLVIMNKCIANLLIPYWQVPSSNCWLIILESALMFIYTVYPDNIHMISCVKLVHKDGVIKCFYSTMELINMECN